MAVATFQNNIANTHMNMSNREIEFWYWTDHHDFIFKKKKAPPILFLKIKSPLSEVEIGMLPPPKKFLKKKFFF